MKEKLKIVVYEDNSADIELAERALSKGLSVPFEIVPAATKEELVSALARCPDIILADYRVPGFDGLQALSLCKRTCPEVPFIFLSGSFGEEFAVETLKRGATDYVLKDHLSKIVPAVERARKEASDLKARNVAEKALQQSKRLLERALYTLTEAVLIYDRKMERVMDCNPVVLDLFSDERGNILGGPVRELFESDVEYGTFRDMVYSEVSSNGFLRGYSSRMKKSGGERFIVKHDVVSLDDDHGNPVYWVDIIRSE